jgi:hypothetical protein
MFRTGSEPVLELYPVADGLSRAALLHITGSEPVLELDPVATRLCHPLVRTGEVAPGIITNAAAAGCHPTSVSGWLLACKKI